MWALNCLEPLAAVASVVGVAQLHAVPFGLTLLLGCSFSRAREHQSRQPDPLGLPAMAGFCEDPRYREEGHQSSEIHVPVHGQRDVMKVHCSSRRCWYHGSEGEAAHRDCQLSATAAENCLSSHRRQVEEAGGL